MKAISEGSDCRCKCVVRPLSRSACRRLEEGSATAQDFYTVETITSGPECKCACIAPPSAVNPCEGEFRLKKLREAGKDNVKVNSFPSDEYYSPPPASLSVGSAAAPLPSSFLEMRGYQVSNEGNRSISFSAFGWAWDRSILRTARLEMVKPHVRIPLVILAVDHP